jgi:hypothetical protein
MCIMDSNEKLTFKFKFGFKTIKENKKRKHKRKGKRNLTGPAYSFLAQLGISSTQPTTYLRRRQVGHVCKSRARLCLLLRH